MTHLYFRCALLFVLSILVLTTCSKREKKIKNALIYNYKYEMGVISSVGELESELKYNLNGKIEEVLNYRNDHEVYFKTIYRYNQVGKLIEEAEYREKELFYKRIILYNDQGKKFIIQDFQEDDGELILSAWLKIYYDEKNNVVEKRYLGQIDQNENYQYYIQTYSGSNPISDIPDIQKEDTTFAKYIYNSRNQLDRIEIYSNQVLLSINQANKTIDQLAIENAPLEKVFSHTKTIKYQYNESDSLILINEVVKGYNNNITIKKIKEYNYNGGMLTEIKEEGIQKIYSKNRKIFEKIIFGVNKLQLYRYTYKYNDNNDLAEVVQYDNANEPVQLTKYEYEYQ